MKKWLREDDTLKRPVAIKVLKRGLDTEEILERFELERQVLAAMNHPGIARLHEAGETPDGTPYFVMEYVQGLTISKYCDTLRLDIRERLEITFGESPFQSRLSDQVDLIPIDGERLFRQEAEVLINRLRDRSVRSINPLFLETRSAADQVLSESLLV